MTDYNYIPEEELIPWTYYYVHNYYTKTCTSNKLKVDIRQYAGYNRWVCDGLGSGSRWLALAEVPELNIDKYKIEK